jgi:uncharacterized membrane protein
MKYYVLAYIVVMLSSMRYAYQLKAVGENNTFSQRPSNVICYKLSHYKIFLTRAFQLNSNHVVNSGSVICHAINLELQDLCGERPFLRFEGSVGETRMMETNFLKVTLTRREHHVVGVFSSRLTQVAPPSVRIICCCFGVGENPKRDVEPSARD